MSADGNGNGNGGDGNGKRPYVEGKYVDGKYVPIPPPSRWKKGQSGNPKGRRKNPAWMRDLARQYTAEALATLANVMRTSKDRREKCAAAMALLDRGWGKPVVTIQRTDFEMPPVMLLPGPESDEDSDEAEVAPDVHHDGDAE